MCVFFFTVCLGSVLLAVVHGCPRQGYWSGLAFPSVGGLPNPETKPKSPELAGEFFTTESPGSPSRVLDTI